MSNDACATPGCGHAQTAHEFSRYDCGERVSRYSYDDGLQFSGCPCTAYRPPRPVPEEGCACGDPRPHGPHEFALQDATVPAPHAEAEARADAERFLERVVAAGEVVTAREAYIAGFIAGYLKGRGND